MRKLLVVPLALSLLTGCGSDSVSDGSSSAAPPAATTRLYGRVETEAPLVGANISFFQADGTPLPTSSPVVSLQAGAFQADLPGSPRDFQVVATLGDESYASAYRNYNGEGLVVNPLTNLVAAHHQAHPGLELAASEAAVKNFLQLPAEHDTRHHLVRGPRPGFHVGKYMAQARSQGHALLVSRLVTAIDGGSSGVSAAQFRDTQTPFWITNGAQLGVSVLSTIFDVEGETDSSYLLGWGISLVAADVSGSDSDAFLALAQALAQLGQEIADMTTALVAELTRASFITIATETIDQLSLIPTLQDSVEDFLANQGTPDQAQALAQQLTATQLTQLLGVIDTAQLGDASIGSPGLIASALSVLQLSSDFYSNGARYYPVVTEVNYFAGQMTAAIGLIVEGFHALSPPDLATAQAFYQQYRQSVAQQVAFQPLPLASDDLVYVRSKGLIFYRHVQPKATYEDAIQKAAGFTVGPYNRYWRVANTSDICGLLDKRQNYSIATLKAAGFDFAATEANPSNRDNSHYFIGMLNNRPERAEFVCGSLNLGVENISNIRYAWFYTQSHVRRSDVAWNQGDHNPYLLVTDAAVQDPSLIPALGELRSLEAVAGPGNSLRAQAAFRVNWLTYLDPPSDTNGADDLYNLKTADFPPTDVTDHVYWSSSDATKLIIQSAPSAPVQVLPSTPSQVTFKPGFYNWLQSGTVNVTATWFDAFNNLRPTQATRTITNTSVPAAQLTGLRIGPRELILNSTSGGTTLNVLGVYSDGSGQLLSSGVTWSTSIPQASVVQVAGQYALSLSSRPAGSSFTVTARSGSVTDTATYYVNIP